MTLLQLHSLLIPGSHNAGAYNKFTSYTGRDGPRSQAKLSLFPPRRHGAAAVQRQPGRGHLDPAALWHPLPGPPGGSANPVSG